MKKQRRAPSSRKPQPVVGDTGGPMFPTTLHHLGMTLRDGFAIEALPTFIKQFLAPGSSWDTYDEIAASCYGVADAMMKIRARR